MTPASERAAPSIIGRTAVLNFRTGKWDIVDKHGHVVHVCDDLHEAAEYLKPVGDGDVPA